MMATGANIGSPRGGHQTALMPALLKAGHQLQEFRDVPLFTFPPAHAAWCARLGDGARRLLRLPGLSWLLRRLSRVFCVSRAVLRRRRGGIRWRLGLAWWRLARRRLARRRLAPLS